MVNKDERYAVVISAMFFVNGAVFANWLPRVDEVRDRIGVSNGGLGVALLGGGLGGVVASFVVAAMLSRFSALAVLRVSSTMLALSFPLLAIVPSQVTLLGLVAFFGFLDVFTDLSMNAEAAAVQQVTTKSIMQRVHGMWSLGFLAGTLVGWAASVADVPLGLHLSLATVALLTVSQIAIVQLRGVEVDAAPVSSPTNVRFSAAVVSIVLLAFGTAAFEITPNEWSTVALRDQFSAGNLKGAGPVAFAIAMLIGRFKGDALVDRRGPQTVLRDALLVVGFGILLVVVAPHALVALLGFFVWGLGVSVMFPQLYLMAATSHSTNAGAGLAAMALAQRAGFLCTTVSIGFLSENTSFRVTFAILLVVAGTFFASGLAKYRSNSSTDILG